MKKFSMLVFIVFSLVGCDSEKLYNSIINIRVTQANLTMKSKTIMGNLTVSYYENNVESEKTLVLLHGFGDDKDTWLQLAIALKNKYHLIIPDFIGYGKSSKPSDINYSLEMQSQRLHFFLEGMVDNAPVIVGNSMGGGIAIKYAEKYPINKLVLVSAMGPDSHKEGYFDKLPFSKKAELIYQVCNKSQMYELLDTLMYTRPFGTPFVIDYLAQKRCRSNSLIKKQSVFIFNQYLNVNHALFNASLNIDVSTLIVWGQEDKIIDVSNADALHNAITNSTVKIYNNVGHTAMQEKPYKLGRDIINFLQ